MHLTSIDRKQLAVAAVAVVFSALAVITAVTRISDLEVTNKIQMTNSSGPTIKTITSDPSGVVTEPRGSLRIRTDTANVYQNQNAVTSWKPFATTDIVTSGAAGLVSASGGGTTNFFRADATWTPALATELSIFLFGDGRDGALTFDCASNVTLSNGTVLAPTTCNGGTNNCYLLVQDIEATNITVSNNCEVNGNVRFMATGTINLNGTNAVLGCNAQNGGVGGGGDPPSPGFACSAGNTTVFNTGGNGGNGVGPTGGGTSATHEPTDAGGAATGTSAGVGTSCGTVIGRGGGGGGATLGSLGQSGGAVTSATTNVGAGTWSSMWQGRADSITTNIRWTSGSGGGAGGGVGVNATGGGGGGGGGWTVVAARTITGTGRITARGGNGANGKAPTNPSAGGGGGGGGGGYVVLYYGTRTGSLTVDAAGGTHGNSTTNGVATASNGADGCAGKVVLWNLSGDGT